MRVFVVLLLALWLVWIVWVGQADVRCHLGNTPWPLESC